MQKFLYKLAQYNKATQEADYTVYTQNEVLFGALTVTRISKKSSYQFSAELNDAAIVLAGFSSGSTLEDVILDFEKKLGLVSVEIQNLFNS